MISPYLVPLLTVVQGASHAHKDNLCEHETKMLAVMDFAAPCEHFEKGQPIANAASVLAHADHIPRSMAQQMLDAVTAGLKADQKEGESRSDVLERESAKLLELHPDSDVARLWFMAFHDKTSGGALAANPERSKSTLAFALRFLRSKHLTNESAVQDWVEIFQRRLIARGPEYLADVVRAGDDHFTLSEKLALYDSALRKPDTLTPVELAVLADDCIVETLEDDSFYFAPKLHSQLPKSALAAEIDGTARRVTPHWREPADRRAMVAIALLAGGDEAGARALFERLGDKSTSVMSIVDHTLDHGDVMESLRHAVLSWHLGGVRPADTFDLIEANEAADHASLPEELMLPLAGDRYRVVVLARISKWLEYRAKEWVERNPADYDPEDPRLTQAHSARIAALRQLVQLGDDSKTAELDAGAKVDLPDAGAPIWTEAPLPHGVQHVVTDGGDDGEDASMSLPTPLPKGFWPVRFEKTSTGWLGVASSQALDPTGEVSGGAYWIFRSADGKNWERPIYTALREYRPYVVRARSAIPLLSSDGTQVQIEVSIRQANESAISFPPIDLSAARTQSNIYVHAALADLGRDSDRDGLSDLVEQRLMLDPHNPDSDGDGVPDGTDPTPNLANMPVGKDAELVAEFFAVNQGMPGIMTGGLMRQGDASLPAFGTALEPEAGTVYIEAGGLDLRGATFTRPTIILDEKAYARAKARFGGFYPYSFHNVIRNADGTKIYFEYTEHWRGGAVHAELVDGHWKVTVLGHWVS